VGTPISFPNIYIPEGGKVAVNAARYFVDGEQKSYSITIDKQDIATCEGKGSEFIFSGLKCGTTTATLTASGEQHSFTITVRKGAGENGWL
jgi:hypothetical protein